jgi:hypothetical protein
MLFSLSYDYFSTFSYTEMIDTRDTNISFVRPESNRKKKITYIWIRAMFRPYRLKSGIISYPLTFWLFSNHILYVILFFFFCSSLFRKQLEANCDYTTTKLQFCFKFNTSLYKLYHLVEVPRSNSPVRKQPVPGNFGDFVEAVF